MSAVALVAVFTGQRLIREGCRLSLILPEAWMGFTCSGMPLSLVPAWTKSSPRPGSCWTRISNPSRLTCNKPVILAVAYPSADNAASASLPVSTLFQPGGMQGPVNLQAQADIYQALLMAVNERPWVGGFVSRGYYPPVVLLDASASTHGKPAADVMWYWYPRFLGITP